MLLQDVASLLAGVACAGIGGELFVRGTLRLSAALRIAPTIVAATLAAFATSSPELSVALNAALAGEPRIALGDALGSNVVNIALVLGIALGIAAVPVRREDTRRDLGVALAVPLATWLACSDGLISRTDGLALASGFGLWLAATVHQARRNRTAAPAAAASAREALLPGVAGLVLLIVAGRLVVVGATGLSQRFGIDEFLVGATIVAVGTSVPELATALVSAFRGHGDVGLGAMLGSNIFNGLFVVAAAALITPIPVDPRNVVVALAASFGALLLVVPSKAGAIPRARGPLLLLLYAAYVTAVVTRLA